MIPPSTLNGDLDGVVRVVLAGPSPEVMQRLTAALAGVASVTRSDRGRASVETPLEAADEIRAVDEIQACILNTNEFVRRSLTRTLLPMPLPVLQLLNRHGITVVYAEPHAHSAF